MVIVDAELNEDAEADTITETVKSKETGGKHVTTFTESKMAILICCIIIKEKFLLYKK